MPEAVSSFDAAPLTCAGVTTYKAAKVAKINPTERVAVFGIGGLGHLAVQYARIMGGTVIGVDVEQTKLDLATELGADHVINARETDPVEAIQALGGADVAIVLAVAPTAFEQAFKSLRRGGRLVCVALPAAGHDGDSDLRDREQGASRSSARSSAPARTWSRCSTCTRRDARR